MQPQDKYSAINKLWMGAFVQFTSPQSFLQAGVLPIEKFKTPKKFELTFVFWILKGLMNLSL